MTTSQVPREQLHELLDRLLDARDGCFEPNDLREFLTAVLQGRGTADAWHEAGLDAARAVPQSPKSTFNERQTRAYHLRFLSQLLLDLGGLQCDVSPLPVSFRHGLVIHDLLTMLGGQGGTGAGKPLLLWSANEGRDDMVRLARRQLVGVVRWRMGRTGKTRDEIWSALMGQRAEKTKLDRWQREFGGAEGEFCRACFEAGATDDRSSHYAVTDDDLRPVIDLANSARGKRAGV